MKLINKKITSTKILLVTHFVMNLRIICESLENNLALTPPMGWSAWGRFRCNTNCKRYPNECVSEWLFREMADKMVEDGYLSAGYEYVLIDDCWLAKKRDASGRLYPDPERFPSGIKNLSDYVHSRGLKLGIYEDYGTKTCEGYPGINLRNIPMDTETFAQWEVDYVKIDGCFSEPLDMEKGFSILGSWLLKTGRPMVYSCSWPFYHLNIGISPNYSVAAATCNLWRNYKDIQDSWSSVRTIINFYGDRQEEFASFAGPGHWNDPDMLIIGNFGLSYEQAKVQMALWAILSAPLIMSHDLRDVKPEFRDILLNLNIIQINQDPLGIQGKRIYVNRRRNYEVWTKPVIPTRCGKFSWVITIVNLDDCGEPSTIIFPLKYTKLRGYLQYYSIIDLFEVDNEIEFTVMGELIARIPPLGVKVYKAIVNEDIEKRGILRQK